MALFSDLPKPLQDALLADLQPGETIIWAEQPHPGRSMMSGFLSWLFFVPWTAFSLYWMAAATEFKAANLASGNFSFVMVFGLPFVLIGIAGLGWPWWLRYKSRSTVYAITNRRAITVESAWRVTVKSYLPANISKPDGTERADGSGDLILRVERYQDSEGSMQSRKIGFMAINNVRNVARLIQELKQSNPA